MKFKSYLKFIICNTYNLYTILHLQLYMQYTVIKQLNIETLHWNIFYIWNGVSSLLHLYTGIKYDKLL